MKQAERYGVEMAVIPEWRERLALIWLSSVLNARLGSRSPGGGQAGGGSGEAVRYFPRISLIDLTRGAAAPPARCGTSPISRWSL